MSAIEISRVEVLALKKLVLINHALSQSLKDQHARMEQAALVRVLNDVTLRADLASTATLNRGRK